MWSAASLATYALRSLEKSITCCLGEVRKLITVFYPWAERAAKNSVFLLSVKYEDLLESPLEDVRAQLRIEKAPEMR